MQRLLSALALALSLALTVGTPLRAQESPAPGDTPAAAKAAAEEAAAKETAWYDKGGSLDEAFGEALGYVSAVAFFDLSGSTAPPLPWTDSEGRTITEAAAKAFTKNYAAIRSGAMPNPHPFPWKDQAGEEIVISQQGQPISTKLPIVVVWLVIGAVLFTLMMRFVNVRMFKHAIQVVAGKFDKAGGHGEGEVSHFQALSSALSATVGLGNIAGVATAIMIGGPGATVWMVAAGLLGMSLKFTECTLGQRYRDIDSNGRVLGGPMRYLKTGLAERGWGGLGAVLSVMFAVFCIGGSLAGGNSFQVNQALAIVEKDVPFFKENGWVFGVIMAVFAGFVIIGGIQRIAKTASKIVPAMCLTYVVSALLVLIYNAGAIPGAFGAMFDGAFSGEAVYGGAIGSLITGFQRAAFSNEAGVGSASIAHSAAKTDYPVREGIVALLEPFIDTVVVCTMTALVITITGVYSLELHPEHAEMIVNKDGAPLTREAFASVDFLAMNVWFPYVLLVAVVLFAFSTMISWSYYGERCWVGLFGPASSIFYKILFLVFIVLGSIVSATNVLEFGDLMILIMAFPNIIGLYFLGGVVKSDLKEYERMLDAGEFD